MFLADETLRNDYYSLRHGISNPQEKKRIVSDLVESKKSEHGLAKKYLETTRMSIADALLENGILQSGRKIIVMTSPASRSVETADIVSEFAPSLTIIWEELRERYFGIFNGRSTAHYEEVWPLDAVDPNHTRFNVESAVAVLRRMIRSVRWAERRYENAHVILSSHGDPLQILETSFRGMDPAHHRELPPLQNAELRLLSVSE